jgi:hypothetical protein
MARSRIFIILKGVALVVLTWIGVGAADEGQGFETATFYLYCYWTGEATLGRVEGVLASRIGHWGGEEVVQVDYDPELTNPATLVEALKSQRTFYSLVVGDEREKRTASALVNSSEISILRHRPRFIESKHSLRTRHPELWALVLTERQAIALNSWSYFGSEMPDVLTTDQKERLASR